MSQLQLIYSTAKYEIPKMGIQILWLHLIRVFMPLSVLVLFYVSTSSQFIHINFVIPVFAFLALSFVFNGSNLLTSESFKYKNWIESASYFFDALMITAVIFSSESKSSLFVVFFFLLILLSGIQYKKEGAISTALICATLFNIMTLLSPENSSSLSIISNNISFFLVGALGGSLGEQVQFLGEHVKVQKEKITQLEDINQLIVNNISSGIVVVDSQYNVTYSNEGALNILDLSEMKDFNLNNSLPYFTAEMNSLDFPKDQIGRFELNYNISNSDKRIIEFLVSHFNSDEKSGYILLLQDLTKSRRLENQDRQKEKLIAVGQLAAGIAHEIRNPLASISGSIQLMDAETSQNKPNKKLMGIALKEIDRLNFLISDFLDFVKPEMSDQDPVSISDILDEVCGILKLNTKLNSNVMQNIQLESKNFILGDRSKLKQAFLNISINAYQAMENLFQAEYKVKSYDDRDKVIVKISDIGKGMSLEQKKRIFEPFHTTKDSGTGLGLAITHKIIESHHAQIFVESELGKGTEFTIEFTGKPVRPDISVKKLA